MLDTEALLKVLAAAPLFGDMPAPDRAACAARFRETRIDKGQMLFARGDAGGQLYIVLEGQVRLAVGNGEGRELSFQIVGAGDLFGEIAALDGRPRSAEAIALAPTRLASLDRQSFLTLRAAQPGISEAAIAFLCRRLREVSDKLETLALYPLEIRLARFLMAALKGAPETPGRRTPLELRFSQSELAQLLGASRPKINAALGALEAQGAIGRTADRLFCDRAKLAKLAQWDEAESDGGA